MRPMSRVRYRIPFTFADGVPKVNGLMFTWAATFQAGLFSLGLQLE